MKKLILGLCALTLLVIACQDDSNDSVIQEEFSQIEVDMSDFYVKTDPEEFSKSNQEDQRKCHSMKVLNEKLKQNPGLEQKMYNIEKHTRQTIAFKGKPTKPGGGNGGGGGSDPTPWTASVTIPVIVNVLEDSAHPITNAHINSQISILTTDFNDNNPNTNGSVPSEFSGLVANADITFDLVGVNRKQSTKSTWGTNDAMKYSSQGGIDATDPSTYLNIWVCEIGGGILGYAQFPGGTAATDGVVIGSDYFGENAAGGVYGHGRTATHEVGHWLNLRHIWGDGRCKRDDFVTDTPSSDRANYACPTYPTAHCRTNDMTMNYMDYVYDDCMYMFTNGQNDRMRALFADGGARVSMR